MPQELHHKDLEDVIYGATLLGAGGGGSTSIGLSFISQIQKEGKSVVLVSPDEIKDDALVVVPAILGAPTTRNKHIPALSLIKKYFENVEKRTTDYVVPLEVGAGNFAVPIHAAAWSNIPLIDGDGAGRSIPSLKLVSFEMHDIPISPMAIAKTDGNGAILFVNNTEWAEKICLQILVAFKGNAGATFYPMTGRQLKDSVIPGTVSLSMKIGSILRKVREEGAYLPDIFTEELDAYVLGIGKVKSIEMRSSKSTSFQKTVVRTERGNLEVYATYGKVGFETEEGEQETLYTNENIIAKLGERILTIAPDLICWSTTDGKPLTNTDLKEGLDVVVLGFEAHEKLRSEKALTEFRRIYKEVGFEHLEYTPIEEII
ncbi:MAG TPA: DUF917 domain-containing protein [Euryarchaeota archaeon]|nr:DUF917 domain-containing protein [Euryarchaeota archaeon]